jgi:4-diphosphocytidyl-2-C-methyl-D-erythritol kinase
MIVFPKAKINLGLRITEKRSDGYHNIETIFYPISLRDALEFIVQVQQSKRDIFTATGIDTGSEPDGNLVIKTIRKLREKHPFPFLKIHLHKAIPVGAGLGGGSSDAVSLLNAINKYFNLSIDNSQMKAIALEIGSDCPFFVDCNPAFASGRGELLKPIWPVLSGYYLLLLNPGIEINTAEAYQNCRPEHPSTSLIELIDHPPVEWKDLIKNDFEDYAFRKHPVIGEIKNQLYLSGALFSSMSGSGSSIYGIFHDKPRLNDKLRANVIFEGVV